MAPNLTLYQMEYCPYCQRVRDAMRDLKIEMPIKDTWEDPKARDELLAGGGKGQVPCLRIEENGKTKWMYESADIVKYLRKQVRASQD